MTSEPEETIVPLGEPEDKILKLIKEAVEDNMHLSQHLFEKGFISKNWQRAQQMWATSINTHKGTNNSTGDEI